MQNIFENNIFENIFYQLKIGFFQNNFYHHICEKKCEKNVLWYKIIKSKSKG